MQLLYSFNRIRAILFVFYKNNICFSLTLRMNFDLYIFYIEYVYLLSKNQTLSMF